MFGTFSNFDEAKYLQRMIVDLRRVAATDSDSIEEFADALFQFDDLLTDRLLKEIASEFMGEDAAVSAANALKNLRPEELEQVVATVRTWREESESIKEAFPEDEFARLPEKLLLLVRDYPSLRRMRKSDRLRRVLGNELTNVEFICDMRPVFDESRERIEALLPVTTMKLSYERQSGHLDVLEIALTSEEVDFVIERANLAKRKLEALESRISRWTSLAGE